MHASCCAPGAGVIQSIDNRGVRLAHKTLDTSAAVLAPPTQVRCLAGEVTAAGGCVGDDAEWDLALAVQNADVACAAQAQGTVRGTGSQTNSSIQASERAWPAGGQICRAQRRCHHLPAGRFVSSGGGGLGGLGGEGGGVGQSAAASSCNRQRKVGRGRQCVVVACRPRPEHACCTLWVRLDMGLPCSCGQSSLLEITCVGSLLATRDIRMEVTPLKSMPGGSNKHSAGAPRGG